MNRRSLAEVLAAIRAAPAGDLILVAGHHPLLAAGDTVEGGTHGGAAALAALADAGADMVLSGHVHFPFDVAYERRARTVRLVGAGTLSRRLRGAAPAFNEIRIGTDRRIEVLVRSFSPAPGASHDCPAIWAGAVADRV